MSHFVASKGACEQGTDETHRKAGGFDEVIQYGAAK
jgi:hypothetical protein